jgi:hypothetical protein
MFGHLHFLPGGNPPQNLRPLLRNLLGGGAFHAHNMPHQLHRCKRNCADRDTQIVYTMMFMTHAQYNKDKWKRVL